MSVITKVVKVTGNWLQDAVTRDVIQYASIDDVPAIDAITDWDNLMVDNGPLAASVKNSVAYTFKY